MIRPINFGFNDETSKDNHYQKKINKKNIAQLAVQEFENLVWHLKQSDIDVHVYHDDNKYKTPDSVFPNNWISTHQNGDVVLYPMLAMSRRMERRPEILDFLKYQGFIINNIIDYSPAEKDFRFLEGTGSMTLDRKNKIAYCSISERSNKELFVKFCKDFKYTPVSFHSFQNVAKKRLPIYHTNVMMCLAESYCIICLECIDDIEEIDNIINFLENSGKELIEISENQVEKFAGNMLELINNKGESILVMSKSAENSLNENQKNIITKYSTIVSSDINTIEVCGGGSARCMIAEIFLPKK
ncbi:MAG: citrulline utilization hydrolase CtlX [Flavobacteriaceae bacterium]